MGDLKFQFLKDLVAAHGPSGFEKPVAQLYRDYVQPFAHQTSTDIMGNVTAIINPDAPLRVMYAGHMDEIGFIVHHIDQNGFLYFNTIGGTDVATEIGQRVWVHGQERVPGVIGRKAIQDLEPAEMSQTPKMKRLWIDIGARSRQEAEAVVSIGSPVTLQPEMAQLLGDHVVGRAFDNKAGLFIASQVLKTLWEDGGVHPQVAVYILGTVQEEIGSRGAETAAFDIAPHTGIVVDMGVATDYPWAQDEDQGRLALGDGPGITAGANTNPIVLDLLLRAAKEENIPFQLQGYGGTSPTDARLLQTNRGGVATGLVSVPLRYMHTPSEVLSLKDVQATVDLVAAYIRRLTPDVDFTPW
ncbi:M20/M25/M40 family metallo-hydrolase [Tianweitania sediminis]|uniref:M20/M25/M40 family metallo-hydrolase n=1 Tax=Tianweitania sediminis TaxID=1502156 RepID=A0A8J7R4X4_9HYPH|nr:M20/M25/M40 family metallo-hydrolase [Tianweitania sediminis]MBP0439840.1 M20/M25/M40 family metallo-hydrolase [Tianweitania sediminis]